MLPALLFLAVMAVIGVCVATPGASTGYRFRIGCAALLIIAGVLVVLAFGLNWYLRLTGADIL